MYTLDVDDQPIAIVNLPRYEAQDFFDSTFPWCANIQVAFSATANFVTRLASPWERRVLVRSFKRKREAGVVESHHFDGYCALVELSDPQILLQACGRAWSN